MSGVRNIPKLDAGWSWTMALRGLSLALLDMATAFLGVYAAWWLRAHGPLSSVGELPEIATHVRLVLPGMALWILALALVGAYSFSESNRGGAIGVSVFLAAVVAAVAFALAGAVSGSYRVGFTVSRALILLSLVFAVCGAWFGRFLVQAVLYRLWKHGIGRKRSLVIGAEGLNREMLADALPAASRNLQYEGKGFAFDPAPDGDGPALDQIDELVYVGALDEARDIPLFFDVLQRGLEVWWVLPRYEGSVAFSERSFYGIRAHHFRWGLATRVGLVAKRVVDLFIASSGLLLSVPLLGLLALLIKIEDGGPCLFTQERVGKDGKLFTMVKLRSMKVDAECAGEGQRNHAEGPLTRIMHDRRVTRIGMFMRRHKLDEIPQFYNVLLGKMSVVGPRPALPAEVVEYEPWQKLRLRVLPGITGPWQVDKDRRWRFLEMVALDVKYILERSFAREMAIIVSTPVAMWKGR